MPRWAKTHRLQPTYCHSAIASPAIPDSIGIPLTAYEAALSINSRAARREGRGLYPKPRFTGTQMERQTTAFIQSDYA